MVHSCCVVGCAKRQNKDLGVKYIGFPQHWMIGGRRAWIRAIRRSTADGLKPWTPNSSSRVCGDHFIGGKLLSYQGIIIN
jgi:hypothetical protein